MLQPKIIIAFVFSNLSIISESFPSLFICFHFKVWEAFFRGGKKNPQKPCLKRKLQKEELELTLGKLSTRDALEQSKEIQKQQKNGNLKKDFTEI